MIEPSGTLVGDVLLPELPPGTWVAYDTETNGLHPDGDPGTDSGDPGSPPARVATASIAYRDPGDPGRILKYAWGFDQGPHPSKDGRIRRPREGGGVEPLDVEKLLANLAKAGYNNGWRDQIGKNGKPLKTRLAVPWTVEQSYEAVGSSAVCDSDWPAAVPRYAMSPTPSEFFAFGMVFHGLAKLPSAESFPVELTKKIFPARTVNGSSLLSPLPSTCTEMTPDAARAPSWKVTFVSVQIG